MKVREIDMESLMAANSPTATGLNDNGDGSYTQDLGNTVEPVNGNKALSNYNVWSLGEDEE